MDNFNRGIHISVVLLMAFSGAYIASFLWLAIYSFQEYARYINRYGTGWFYKRYAILVIAYVIVVITLGLTNIFG